LRDPQSLEPGSSMPAYNKLSNQELDALAAYLESLR